MTALGVDNRKAQFNAPEVFAHMGCHVGIRRPPQINTVLQIPVRPHHGTGRTDGDLVIGVRLCLDQEIEIVAIPDFGIAIR